MRRIRHCNRLPGFSRPFPARAAVPAFIDSSFVAPRAAMTGMTAIRQLAEDFRQGAHREGGISRDDLQTLGWTRQQLDDHADAARIRAQQLTGASA